MARRIKIKQGGYCADCKREWKTDDGYFNHKCKG